MNTKISPIKTEWRLQLLGLVENKASGWFSEDTASADKLRFYTKRKYNARRFHNQYYNQDLSVFITELVSL